jgi:Holliday junction DNA helicase RuvA
MVEVAGFIVQVHVPPAVAASCEEGRPIHLHTHLHVRDDGLALYGFPSAEELDLFRQLLGVNGVGPRLALGVLSVLGPEGLRSAVDREDVAALSRVPGVGKRTAGRIVLEMKGKVAKEAPGDGSIGVDQRLVEALTALGYTPAEAQRAVAALPAGSSGTLEDAIKACLHYLSEG